VITEEENADNKNNAKTRTPAEMRAVTQQQP
jgi:hypothetical protein